MSSEETPPVDETPETTAAEPAPDPAAEPAEPAGATERRRPASPAAAAASRARRIGGRPVSGHPTASDAASTRETAGAAPAASQPDPDPDAAATRFVRPVLSLRKRPAPTPAAAGPDGPADDAPPAGPADDAPAEPVPAWLNWAPAAVLTAGALVMAVLLVVFSHGVWWGPDPDRAPSAAKISQVRDQVQAAAKSCVAATNDYSYEALGAYERKALSCTTGQFTSKLRSTIDNLIKKNAPAIKAKQTAQISRSGIQSVTPDGKQWAILVFGQLSVVNANYPDGRTDPFGALVTMEKTHGKWLMADLATVSSPVSGG